TSSTRLSSTTPASTYDEVAATKTMIKRTDERMGLKPERLAADTAYGTGKFLHWVFTVAMRASGARPCSRSMMLRSPASASGRRECAELDASNGSSRSPSASIRRRAITPSFAPARPDIERAQRNGVRVFKLEANYDLIISGLIDSGRISEHDALA